MATDKSTIKYINMILSELADRAQGYKSAAQDMRKSPRQRAIYKALYMELVITYNWARQYGAMIVPGLDNTKSSIDWEIITMLGSNMPRTPEQVDELINEVFENTREERKTAQKTVESTLLIYLDENPDIAQKVMNKLKNIQAEVTKKSKGNPKLGGFTRALIAKGYVPEVAKIEAEKQLANISMEERAEEIKHDPQIQAAIKKVFGKKTKEEDNSAKLLALLEPGSMDRDIDTCSQGNKENKENISDPDFSDFDDPENL
jgi:hypothetical protein